MSFKIVSGGAVTTGSYRYDIGDDSFQYNSPAISLSTTKNGAYSTIDGEYLITAKKVYRINSSGQYVYYNTLNATIPGLLYANSEITMANHTNDGSVIAMSTKGNAPFSHEIYLISYDTSSKTFTVLDSIDSTYTGYGYYSVSINPTGSKLVFNAYVSSNNDLVQCDIAGGSIGVPYGVINLSYGTSSFKWISETDFLVMNPSEKAVLVSWGNGPTVTTKYSSAVSLNIAPGVMSGAIIDRGGNEYVAMQHGYTGILFGEHRALSVAEISGTKYMVVTANRVRSDIAWQGENSTSGWLGGGRETWGCVVGIPLLSTNVSTQGQVVFGSPVVLWEDTSGASGSFEDTCADKNGIISALGYWSDGSNNHTASIILSPSILPVGNIAGTDNGYRMIRKALISNGVKEQMSVFTDSYIIENLTKRRSYVKLLRPRLDPP